MEHLITDMQDCSVAIDTLHVLMGACLGCGLALGAIIGCWVASHSFNKKVRQINDSMQEWMKLHNE